MIEMIKSPGKSYVELQTETAVQFNDIIMTIPEFLLPSLDFLLYSLV